MDKKMAHVLLFYLLATSLLTTVLAQDVPYDLEGGVLYNIAWLNSNDMKLADSTSENSPDMESSVKTKLLPNQLLTEEDGVGESLLFTSSNNEQYACVLPNTMADGEREGDSDDSSTELRPDVLLRTLQQQCTKLLMGYWTYELCHGDHLRQYHEEKLQDGQVEIDEYFLGDYATENAQSAEKLEQKQSDKIPTWPFGGRDYPYYSVVIGGGTPCDVKGDEPRSVLIRYICDQQAFKYGSLLRVDEATTCKYEALVSTPQLCQNNRYRLRENPLHTITCYPEGDSPRRPKALLEQELMLSNLKASASKATPTKRSPGMGGESPKDKGKSLSRGHDESNSKVFELDEQFIRSFLNGEMCLRGGAGWWFHELCYGQHVKQLHIEPDGERVEVNLGYWSEPEHRVWFTKSGKRKTTKTQVVHLYKGGDICEVTGTSRQCQVKYKCVKTTKSSQISLNLEEPTTCSYSLTVEGVFICSLLDHLDEYGVFDKDSFEAQSATRKATNDQLEVDPTTEDVIERDIDRTESRQQSDGRIIDQSKEIDDLSQSSGLMAKDGPNSQAGRSSDTKDTIEKSVQSTSLENDFEATKSEKDVSKDDSNKDGNKLDESNSNKRKQ